MTIAPNGLFLLEVKYKWYNKTNKENDEKNTNINSSLDSNSCRMFKYNGNWNG
jgi:hypothetical protein